MNNDNVAPTSFYRRGVRRVWLRAGCVEIGVLILFLAAPLAVPTMAGAAQTEDAAANDSAPYRFGVFPHYSIPRMEEIYAPIAASLGAAINRPVRFQTRSTFARFTADLFEGRYDIALVQPFDYVVAHDEYGYLPIARRGEPLSAVIMVHPDSAYQSLADLSHTTVALPPLTAAVSRLSLFALIGAGILPERDITINYQRNHEACLQQVLIGHASACGTAANPVRFFAAKMKTQLRRLHETGAIPHALFVVHRRVSGADRDRLKMAILNWPQSADGRNLLARGKFKRFVPAIDGEYEIVRRYLRETKAK